MYTTPLQNQPINVAKHAQNALGIFGQSTHSKNTLQTNPKMAQIYAKASRDPVFASHMVTGSVVFSFDNDFNTTTTKPNFMPNHTNDKFISCFTVAQANVLFHQLTTTSTVTAVDLFTGINKSAHCLGFIHDAPTNSSKSLEPCMFTYHVSGVIKVPNYWTAKTPKPIVRDVMGFYLSCEADTSIKLIPWFGHTSRPDIKTLTSTIGGNTYISEFYKVGTMDRDLYIDNSFPSMKPRADCGVSSPKIILGYMDLSSGTISTQKAVNAISTFERIYINVY